MENIKNLIFNFFQDKRAFPLVLKKDILFLAFLGLLCGDLQAQNNKIYSHKGQFYLNWGYNRADFSNSDIHFKGKGYDFMLNNVVAHNRPTHYHVKDYLSLSKLTIPQYNFKIGKAISHG